MLNPQQLQVVELYKDYLQSPAGSKSAVLSPPPIVLLTGKGGTGKSYVIHELLRLGNHVQDSEEGKRVWTAANNNLNAADINGYTIASLLKQTIEPCKESQQGSNKRKRPQKRIRETAVTALQKKGPRIFTNAHS